MFSSSENKSSVSDDWKTLFNILRLLHFLISSISCVLGPEIESACNQPCFFTADSISGPKTQNCDRGIFFNAPSFFLEILPDFKCLYLCFKNSKSQNYHNFGIFRTSAFTWYHLYRSYLFKNSSNLRFSFSNFGVFWHFQHRALDVTLLNH